MIVILEMIKFLCCHIQKTSWWEDNLVNLLSELSIILIFFIGYWIDRRIRRQNISREWYYTVIIQPNLGRIDKFYKSIKLSFETSTNLLLDSKGLPHEEYLDLKSEEIRKLQVVRNEFEFEFISLVSAFNLLLYNDIINCINQLDSLSSILDSDELSKESIKRAAEILRTHKSSLLTVLYRPIEN